MTLAPWSTAYSMASARRDVGPVARGIEKLHRHDLHGPDGPRDADAVVADGTDLARGERAVAVLIDRIIGIGDEVPADQIVGKWRVSPSWVEPLAQPPDVVGASKSVAVMIPSPLVSVILPGPLIHLHPVHHGIQVRERDHSVIVHVRQVWQHARRDLGLIDPDVV